MQTKQPDPTKPRKWRVKFKDDEPIVPLYDEEVMCEREGCNNMGAADFGTERLCKQCTSDDVFSDYNNE